MSKISQIWKVKELRNRILIVAGLLVVTRILAHIPIPGIDATNLRSLLNGNQLLGLFDIFSGGGLRNFSIVMLGVGPYITASIIMQLLTVIIPKLGELQKEGGEAGRAKINQYMRYLTVPLTAIQGYGTIVLLSRSTQVGIGDLTSFGNTITGQNLVTLISYLAVALVVIGGVVLITEAQRNIPVSYAKRVRGNKMYGGVNTHLPLRVNQAGVIPIIFAISILLFPGLIANFFSHAKTEAVANAATAINNFFQNQTYQAIIYFILVVAFTYFYTAIVFNPDEISDNIQKQGGFVPGLRPGRQTADFLYKVLNRITLVGALFLGLIAVLPNIIQGFTHTQALTLGGTSLLIAVSVVIEVMKQVQAQMVMRDYEDF